MKKFLVISIVVLGLFSCKDEKKDAGNDGISVTSITCSEHEVSIYRGYTTAVTVTILPEVSTVAAKLMWPFHWPLRAKM